MKVNAAGRGQLADGLRALGVGCVDSQTNFLLMGPIEDAAELSEKLLHRGVIVRPFGDRIRITVGTDVENSRFLASLAELL
jgi:histidinol-phosphate aminotransferase